MKTIIKESLPYAVLVGLLLLSSAVETLLPYSG